MTVQDIIDAVSIDTRQVLQPSGNDANVILSWVDRVHKDVLHSSIYVNQNLNTVSFTTVPNQFTYVLSPSTPIRRVVSIFDTTFNMSLTPSDAELNLPTPTMAKVEESQGRAPSGQGQAALPHQVYKFGGTPEYFRFIAPSTIRLRPAPPTSAYVSTMNVTYEQLVQTLSSFGSELIVPDDGKDVVCAGVNWMAMAYIGRQQEAMSWFQLFQQLKGGDRTGVIR